jgi:hypothetical protein
MHPDHPDTSTDPAPRQTPRWAVPATVFGVLLLGGALTTSLLTACWRHGLEDGPVASGGGSPPPSSQPLPQGLFRDWPGDRKPDVALILTGQQHSYLKFCGCSTPQLGGFERRYNFMAKLRERGWPLVAADLGDLVHDQGGVHDQSLLKYETAMKALQALGYVGIALGENDYNLPLIEGLTRFTLQYPDAFPKVLAANLADRETLFPLNAQRSMVGTWQPAGGKDRVPVVGVIGLTGRSAMKGIQDPAIKFLPNNQVLTAALQQMETAKVELKVLLFQGAYADAKECAQKFFPGKFDVVLCLSEEDTPPSRPDVVGRTIIVRVGHKGKFVGVVGAYRTGKAAQPFELYYQKVDLGPEYETDADREKGHPMIKLLQEYAQQVKDQDFVGRSPKTPITLANEKLTYVGSQQCAGCHQAAFARWQQSEHSHAFDALVKKATKPTLRQYDPECVVCHTVGFAHTGGYRDEQKAAFLKNVGCENCHGPGSAHVREPKNSRYYAALSPWKANPTDLLPAPEKLAKGIEALAANEKAVLLRVDRKCQECHDQDNDPHFKFEQYWPKVVHGKSAK